MQIRNVCHVLPAALLLITVGSPSVHAGFEQSRSDESVRTTHTYEDNPLQLRSFIDQQVGIDKLKVPATNADIPVPPDPAGTEKLPDGSFKTKDRYQTTEAKRFLGRCSSTIRSGLHASTKTKDSQLTCQQGRLSVEL